MTQLQSLGQENPLEKGTAAHFSIVAWRIPWTEEPNRLLSMGSQRVTEGQETRVPQCSSHTVYNSQDMEAT